MAYFERGGGEPFVVIGTGVNVTLAPRSCREGWLRVYAIREEGRKLEFMHKVSSLSLDLDAKIETDFTDFRRRPMISQSASRDSRVTC